MASLANQTISSTYDGLIKTSTDQPVPATGVQLLEDGLGNSLSVSIGRVNNGIEVSGTVTATAFVGDGSGLTGISVSPTLDEVTTNGATTTNSITVGNVTSTSFIKSGGTSAQFLKADGTVDSNTYLTSFTETNDLTAAVVWANVPDANITQSSVTQHQAALSITESQISDLQSYLTAESDTLDSVTTRGATTTNAVTVGALTASSIIKSGGTASQFLKADGSVDSSVYLTSYTETDTLDSVTGRGASTTNAVTVGGATVNGNLSVTGTIADSSGDVGTSGQILSSTGTGTNWIAAPTGGGGTTYTIQEISTNTTAQKDYLYVMRASLTLTLPASPSVGDKVAVANMSGTITPVVARNGNLIAGLAEDMTIDVDSISVEFIYSGANEGWILFVDSILGYTSTTNVNGSGTTNYISKWSDADTLTDSVIYDDGTNVGIGTTSPAKTLELQTTSPTIRLSGDGANAANTLLGALEIYNRDTSVAGANVAASIKSYSFQGVGAGAYLTFSTSTGNEGEGVEASERMRIDSSGNVGIGNTPAAWSTGNSLEIGTTGNLALHNSAPIGNLIGFNTYYNSAFKRKATAVALGYLQDSEGHKFYFNGSGAADSTFTPSEKLRIQSGGGISFNGDTAAANALDDYEEGTWTIGIAFGGGSTGAAYYANTGTYTKIGRKVTVIGYLDLQSKGSSTGSTTITGLPFTVGAASSEWYSACSMRTNRVAFGDGIGAITTVGTTVIALEELVSSTVSNRILLSNNSVSDNASFIFSLTYFTN